MIKCLLIPAVLMYWICFVNAECGDNEMFVECAHCGPKTCEHLGYPIPCGSSCRAHCACIDGYVRGAEEKCILKEECPTCGGDKNATSGCGNHCGKSCSDYSEDNKICLTGCRYNSCDCRRGFVFHDVLQICILPNECCFGGSLINPQEKLKHRTKPPVQNVGSTEKYGRETRQFHPAS